MVNYFTAQPSHNLAVEYIFLRKNSLVPISLLVSTPPLTGTSVRKDFLFRFLEGYEMIFF
jgi:hypothetical protein